jgi:glutathione peroxidase-family protein
MTIFDYFVKRNNISVPLSQYKKKVILVVNVASE